MKIKLIIMGVLILMSLLIGSAAAADTACHDIISDENETLENEILSADESSFADLADEIENAGVFLNLTKDYTFDNATDKMGGIDIFQKNLVINGNGHIIDGADQSNIFSVMANNVTINNLILINANSSFGGALVSTGSLNLNNVTFANNYASEYGGAIVSFDDSVLNCNNCRFIDNYAPIGSSIYVINANLNLFNSGVTSKIYSKRSQIFVDGCESYIDNVTFSNISSDYAPAIYLEGSNVVISNSRFINLTANITAGAIAFKNGGNLTVADCEFINTTSEKNAGVILADISGVGDSNGTLFIMNSLFKNTYSEFGGAILQLGGELTVNTSVFLNNNAFINGGSVYISNVKSCLIDECNFISNGVVTIDNYPTYGGAIYSDLSNLTVNASNFIENTAGAGNAIYAYDTSYIIENSLFENNTNPIYTFFDKESVLKNNIFINDDNVSTNNTVYPSCVVGQGMNLTLINNTIDVDTLPERFDLRDWNWVSPVKNQGNNGACWTFGMIGALESALLKATGIKTDLSENNIQNTMLIYSIYGSTALEGGCNLLSTGYLLSWLGVFPQDTDSYDELGKISPLIRSDKDIHIQDVMFTANDEIPYGTKLKRAILNYAAFDASYNGQSTSEGSTPYLNPETNAQYVDQSPLENESLRPNHLVSIVGWDDNFPKEKFLITPPGDGAWIVKNTWGPEWGDNGYLYVSYYDKSLLLSTDTIHHATSIIIENTVPYNKNYQYDTFWDGTFLSKGENISYFNQFESYGDDLIAGVGTYFNYSGINYKVEIFVNDVLKLTQEGISPYFGYHTIKLNNYIPVKKGDIFKAVITSNSAPISELNNSRMHQNKNNSFISYDGKTWQDCYDSGFLANLKVYTVADDSKITDNENITLDYGSGSYFTVKVVTSDGHSVGAGAEVNFTINGKSVYALTDDEGIAKIEITELPGTYEMTTIYNNKTYKNIVTVNEAKCEIYAENLTKYYKGPESFNITVKILKKAAAGKNVTFEINGIKYIRTSDGDGKASIAINLNPGVYTVITEVEGVKAESVGNVKSTIDSSDITKTYRNDTQYYASFLDVKGNDLKNRDVKFNINGVTYTRTTNQSGVACLNINLDPGVYIITAENPENGELVSSKVTVLSLIVENNDLTRYYKNDSQYTLKVLDDEGNPVGAGAEVVFNINGVFYTRSTDATGYVKLNINFEPGNYIVTAQYKGCMVSNSITVLSVLKTHDITMKYHDGTKFEAKVLDGQGKAYSCQSVKFNINGVIYERITQDDGISRLDINLMAGEYIITSAYNGYYISNKITITA